MKVAIYIEDGVTQLVLTPQNEWEKDVTKKVAEGHQQVSIRRGEFYECQGGWYRHGTCENSLIFRMDLRQEGTP